MEETQNKIDKLQNDVTKIADDVSWLIRKKLSNCDVEQLRKVQEWLYNILFEIPLKPTGDE